MANRPPFLCELDKGKFIDTQFGFVDTFNWAVRAIDNLKGGTNCEVEWVDDDHPVINVNVPNDYGSEGGGGGSGGGGIDEAVYDVAAATQGGHDGIEVTYADNRSPTFIQFPSLSVDAVEDITRAAGNSDGDELNVIYTNGNTNTVPLYTTLSGTNNTSDKDTEFKFTSALDSNVVVTISDKQIQLGVYYI